MNELGVGLLNGHMVQEVIRRWEHGAVAAVCVKPAKSGGASEAAIGAWERAEKSLFWKQRMDGEHYYLLYRRDPSVQAERQALESLGRLRERLDAAEYSEGAPAGMDGGAAGAGRHTAGIAFAYPVSPGQSPDLAVLRMLGEAAANVSAGGMEEAWDRQAPVRPIRHGADEPAAVATAGAAGAPIRLTIGHLAAPVPVLKSDAQVSEAARLFESNPKEQGAVIVKDGMPVGLLMKEKLHQLLAGQFGLPLYWNRPVVKIMNSQPLIVDESETVDQVSQLAMSRDYAQLYDIVIITRAGQLAGAATIRSILERLTALRTEAARDANPLTGLPGNEGIQAELRRRLDSGRPFAVLYADLDYFKWFNDCYGFSLGDELIRFLAKLIQSAVAERGSRDDFVGHIGGDDFIALLEPERAEELCRLLVSRFDREVRPFYGGAEGGFVEDRSGNRVGQEGVTLSLSLLLCDGRERVSAEEVSRLSARLKKRAKLRQGSVYEMDSLTAMFIGEERK